MFFLLGFSLFFLVVFFFFLPFFSF